MADDNDQGLMEAFMAYHKAVLDAQLTELRERIAVSGGSAGARAARFRCP